MGKLTFARQIKSKNFKFIYHWYIIGGTCCYYLGELHPDNEKNNTGLFKQGKIKLDTLNEISSLCNTDIDTVRKFLTNFLDNKEIEVIDIKDNTLIYKGITFIISDKPKKIHTTIF